MDRNSEDPVAPTPKTEALADGSSFSEKSGAKATGRGEHRLLKDGLTQPCEWGSRKGLYLELSQNLHLFLLQLGDLE